MNDLLLKILERYELDKPILMSDKLDIIWDKRPKTIDDDQSLQKHPDPDIEYQRVLRESVMTAEEAHEMAKKANERRLLIKREKMKNEDNVNKIHLLDLRWWFTCERVKLIQII